LNEVNARISACHFRSPQVQIGQFASAYHCRPVRYYLCNHSPFVCAARRQRFVPEEKVNVICEFLGGGFGGKSWSWPHTLLAALAAKVIKRPVRLQLTRAQMYSMAGHQAATVQTVTLGASCNGKLTGIRHDSINPTSVFDAYVEYAAIASRHLWGATGGISTSHKVVHVNRNSPVVLRAPMEAQGHFALECAMDELAYVTGVDPVELRLRNDTDIDPYSGRPFSTRALRECLTKGAAGFGWDKRTLERRCATGAISSAKA
jgi:xanthine dehydrogenase YagR molybdenum-binding subunit